MINVVSRRAVLVLFSVFCCDLAAFASAQSAPRNSAEETFDLFPAEEM